MIWLITLALARPLALTADPVFEDEGSAVHLSRTGRISQWLLDHEGPSDARVTWKSASDAFWLFGAGHEPVHLAVPPGVEAASGVLGRWSLPGVAIEPGGSWVALRFPSGAFGVVEVSGALRWSAFADVAAVDGPHVAFDVVYPPDRSGPDGRCGNSGPEQAPPPTASLDGALVVAAGRVREGPEHVVHVWDAASGDVRHRFVFDAPTSVLGFRSDGRLVVQASRTVFALSIEVPMGEPEVVAVAVVEASLRDGEVVTEGTYRW